MKLGVVTFLCFHYMKTSRATSDNMAKLALEVVPDPAAVQAMVVDSTTANYGMVALLRSHFPWWIFLFCAVHVIDLLIEDIAKEAEIAPIILRARRLVVMILKHPLVREEFDKLVKESCHHPQQPWSLRLFPKTRFAYMYLMLYQIYRSGRVLDLLAESPLLQVVMQLSIKGAKVGTKRDAVRLEWQNFIATLDDRTFRRQIRALLFVVSPLSMACFYLQGFSAPLSHIYPVYMAICTHLQQEWPSFVTLALSSATLAACHTHALGRTWGNGRLVGVLHDAHLAAFFFDIEARAAAQNDNHLIHAGVIECTNRVLMTMHHEKPLEVAIMLAQTQQWAAASGGSFASYIIVSVELAQARFATLAGKNDESQTVGAAVAEVVLEHHSSVVDSLIERLKLTTKPTSTWSIILNQPPQGASDNQIMAHKLFCSSIVNLQAVVGHTGGVEQMGKAFKYIQTRQRCSLAEETLNDLAYIFHNTRLAYPDMASDSISFDDFAVALLEPEDQNIFEAESETYAPRFQDSPHPGEEVGAAAEKVVPPDEAEEGEEDEEEDGEEDGEEEGEVDTSAFIVPDGYMASHQAPLQPLTADYVGRWIMAQVKIPKTPMSWRLGKLTKFYDPKKPGRYAELYNFDVQFAGIKGVVGMKLEANGATTKYEVGHTASPEGTWFFVSPSATS